MLRSLDPDRFLREFHHPESDARVRLDVNVATYAWHGRHHLAQIRRVVG